MLKKALVVLVVLVTSLLMFVASPLTANAAKGCTNCDATVVVVNGDGTITASTTAVPNGGCVGAVSPTKYSCVLKVFSPTNLGVTESTGGPTTMNVSQFTCPCTAQFWVHAGQWHAYSAMSDPFGG